MFKRLGPGPVLEFDWLIATRRWQLYAIRSAFVCTILAGMVFVFRTDPDNPATGQAVSRSGLAHYGQRFYLAITSIELAVVLLVAPAMTAGAICLDKARGTLDHMLATDLSNAEIILGKLSVRLAPVLGLIICVLPIMALAGLLGGIDPKAVIGSFLAAIGCAVLGSSLALTLSVWGRKTRDVLTLTYLMIIMWVFCRYLLNAVWGITVSSSLAFLAPALTEWLDFVNPFYLAWAPYLSPGKTTPLTALGFLALCLGTSTVLVGLATWRIRAVARRAASAARSASRFPCRLSGRHCGRGSLARLWTTTPSCGGSGTARSPRRSCASSGRSTRQWASPGFSWLLETLPPGLRTAT